MANADILRHLRDEAEKEARTTGNIQRQADATRYELERRDLEKTEKKRGKR